MKKLKLITMMLFMLLTTTSFSQDIKLSEITYENNFKLSEYSKYLGCYIKIKSSETYINLYDTTMNKVEYKINGSYGATSNIDSVINKIYEVKKINGKDLTIQDIKSKQYFVYYHYREYNFPFYTSKIEGVNLSEEDIKINRQNKRKEFCQYITSDIDEFDGTTTYTETIDGVVGIVKVISKSSKTYYLALNTSSSHLSIGSGCTILFTDGTKWVKYTKVDSDYYSGAYRYSVFITLTQAELNVLKTKTIKGFKLYIYDEMIDIEDSKDFQAIVSCIISK